MRVFFWVQGICFMRLLLPCILLLWVIGCGAPDRSKLTEEVLRADPKFRSLLNQHEGYASNIETAEREFALKRATVQRTIQKLRQDLADSQKAVKKKKARYKELIEPERRRLEFTMSMAREELRTKRVQRSSIGRSIARLRKVLKAADETWSEQERKRQDAQLGEMLRDAKRLEEEMAVLKEHIRLLKLKLLLIRL